MSSEEEAELTHEEQIVFNTISLIEEGQTTPRSVSALVQLFKSDAALREHIMASLRKPTGDHDGLPDLGAQVDKLAEFIMNEVPGEPSQDEGAVDCALRVLAALLYSNNRNLELKRQAEAQCERMRQNWLQEKRRREHAEDNFYAIDEEMQDHANAHKEELNEVYHDRALILALLTKYLKDVVGDGNPRLYLDEKAPNHWQTVVAFDLNTGEQVSWHLSADDAAWLAAHLTMTENDWDGHDTPEKHKRIKDVLR